MFTGASIELKTCNAALLEAPGKSWEEVVFPLFINYIQLCCLNFVFPNIYKLSICRVQSLDTLLLYILLLLSARTAPL